MLLTRDWMHEIDDEIALSKSYFDSKEFKEYQRRVERLILKCADERGMTTRAIHESLGWRARYEWTQDALDGLKTIEPRGVVLTRYRPAGKRLGLRKRRLDYAFGKGLMSPQFK